MSSFSLARSCVHCVSKVSWLPVPQWLGNNTLTARAVMRKEED